MVVVAVLLVHHLLVDFRLLSEEDFLHLYEGDYLRLYLVWVGEPEGLFLVTQDVGD